MMQKINKGVEPGLVLNQNSISQLLTKMVGYPHAIGHDPGFTYPIFKIDYSEKRQSGDCRYFIPKGLVVVPDVSCALSFSSKTVKTTHELSKALSVSTSVHGGGWGASFSASAGYKESYHEMSSGESVYIFSKAKCRYYFTQMVTQKPPPFTDSFLDWVFKLNSTNDKDTYIDFFETFGTHFQTYTSFGSRFTYQYKMSSTKYQSEKENDVSVEAAASYSGLFSAGADFKLNSDQKEAASRFLNSVETKTITVGAPPPEDGKALTWASTVKDNPVPMEYSLESIEYIFTKNFMSQLNVDYNRIRYNIQERRLDNCKHLQNTGQLDTCENVRTGFSKIKILTKTKLYFHYKRVNFSTLNECTKMCLDEIKCEAISYCVQECTQYEHYCYMYDHGGRSNKTYQRDIIPCQPYGRWCGVAANENKNWQSAVFSTKIQQRMEFNATNIKGVRRSSFNAKNVSTESACKSRFNSCDPRIRTALSFFRRDIPAAEGIVFVVDASNSQSLPQARQELNSILTDENVSDVPILVLGNKADKRGCNGKEQLTKELGIEQYLSNIVSPRIDDNENKIVKGMLK
ncbi:unnamed protein product [Mytilus edulis]|uniref:small monomeric GTPase n=1 Tax=Mytilus edulis TaxID=6550 RepID=A0A8S3QHG9_MYTED|nr:unnamed protein product [Mytilus edulis]